MSTELIGYWTLNNYYYYYNKWSQGSTEEASEYLPGSCGGV